MLCVASLYVGLILMIQAPGRVADGLAQAPGAGGAPEDAHDAAASGDRHEHGPHGGHGAAGGVTAPQALEQAGRRGAVVWRAVARHQAAGQGGVERLKPFDAALLGRD